MKRFKPVILFAILILVLGIGIFLDRKFDRSQNPDLAKTPSPAGSASPSAEFVKTSPPVSPTASPLPDSYLIKNVPFQPQAPFANWDELHDEACEEASVILVKWWQDGKSSISAQEMEDEIQKMVAWEIQYFGSHKDLTISETAEMAKSFYGLSNWRIEKDISIEDIKREVSENHPVILPSAGRLLGNPYFRSPGPIYHMMVVIGYEGNRIIVQDVGTRRGDHYEYNERILYNAIHDWNGSPETIEGGAKNMLVFN